MNKKKKVSNVDDKTIADTNLYIQRDNLIELPCTRDRTQASTEKYRVLAILTKYYNKWFVAIEDKSRGRMVNLTIMSRIQKSWYYC